jgi:hypothetical protein
MEGRMTLPALLASLVLLLSLGSTARADSCDGLTVRLIRGTGVALAGRSGSLVVFGAADADRMSLDCAAPRRLLFRSDLREPPRAFFVLIGLAARTLTGAPAEPVETLALRLHQDSLLTGAPQLGRVGGAVLRCDPGDRPDGFGVGSLCRVAADRPQRGLSRAAGPG